MLDIIKYILSQREWYWKLYRWINEKALVFFVNLLMDIQYRLRSVRSTYRLFVRLSKNVPVILFLCTAALSVCNLLFIFHPQIILSFIGQHKISLQVTATISGVFVGMLYSGIISVGNALYKDLQVDAKQRIYQFHPIRFKVSFLVFLTALCILFSIPPSDLKFLAPLKLLVIWSFIITIFFTVDTGFHLMNDISSVWTKLFNEINASLKLAKFSNSNLQKQVGRMVIFHFNILDVFKNFMSKEEDWKKVPLLDYTNDSLKLLQNYLQVKKSIPKSSSFHIDKPVYEKIYRDNRWGFIDTLSHPQKNKKEYLWFEDFILSISLECMNTNFKSNNYRSVSQCLNSIHIIMKILVYEHQEISFVLDFHNKLRKCIFSEENLLKINNKNLNYFVAISDSYNLIYTEIILCATRVVCKEGFFKYNLVKNNSIFFSEKEFNKIKWKNKISVYKSQFSYFLHDIVEDFYNKINFEIKIEGKKITPSSKILKILRDESYSHVGREIIKLTTFHKQIMDLFIEQGKVFEFLKKNDIDYTILSCIYDRFFEHLNKFQLLIKALKESKDYDFRKGAIESLSSHVEKYEDLLLNQISKTLVDIPINPSKDCPDFFGKLFYRLNCRVLDSILKLQKCNRGDLYSIFIAHFRLIASAQPTKSNLYEENLTDRIRYIQDLTLDLMTLSGYIFIISEYSEGKTSWDMLKSFWDEYLKNNPKANLRYLRACIRLENNSFRINDRPIPNVKDSFYKSIADKFKIKVDRWRGVDKEKIKNLQTSRYIKSFLKKDFSGDGFDGYNIFMNVYLIEKFNEVNLEVDERDKEFRKNAEDFK